MKTISIILTLPMILSLIGCEPENAGTRVAALPDGAWQQSEWISVAAAKVAGEAEKKVQRSADGTAVFRTILANAKDVKRVRWMSAGLGVYDLFVNGTRVGSDFLKPGFTHCYKTRRSFTYDITELVETDAGAVNAFGVEVAPGWWSDMCTGYMGKKCAFRGVFEITFADGSVELKGTKASEWEGTLESPVTHSGIFDGEEFDARLARRAAQGADVPLALGGCEVNTEFKGEILPTTGAEIVTRCDLAMKRGPITLKKGETRVVDFGQNCAGVPFFRFKAQAGTVLTALPGEMLNDADKGQRGSDGPKGSVYRENLRNDKNGMRIVYTFAGQGVEEYLPRFTFLGYRYIALSATDEVEIEMIASVPVTSITKAMETGRLETGHARINRFIQNVYWGQLSNYLSIPTDCPQRNERQGWTADTQVFSEAGAFNANTYDFMRKFLRDLRDTQTACGSYTGVAPYGEYGEAGDQRFGWADCGVIVPFVMWRQFGRTEILSEHWESMEKFMTWLAENRYAKERALDFQWGDWLSYEDYESCSGRFLKTVKDPNGKDTQVKRPEAVLYWKYLGGCYWVLDARYMRTMAAALGKKDAAAKYAKMADDAAAYVKREFLKDGQLPECLRALQTPALFALHLGLLEGANQAAVKAALLKNFKDHGNCLQTGFLGTSILMDTLVEIGEPQMALTLLLQDRNPSWLYSVDQGATTIWERWNSYTKDKGFGPVGMNSFNHYAYGQVLGWMYRNLGGIAADPAAPGFRHIIMKPHPDARLGFVNCEYQSAAGLIKSAWRYEGDIWVWDFTIPDGASASVSLPGEQKPTEYKAGSYTIRINLQIQK